MTQEQDVISKDQESLTTEAEPTSEAPKYVTQEEFADLNRKLEDSQRETRGLQARVDRDRTDRQREEHLRAAQVRKGRLETQMGQADEANRPIFESQIATEDERITSLQQPAQEPQASNGPAPASDPQWEPVYSMVRGLGLDPEDSRIDYSAFTRPGIPDGDRLQTFMSGVRPLIGTAQAPPAPTPQQPRTVSPPTDGSPTTGGARTSAHESRIAFINGEINLEQYQGEMRRLGQPV